MNAIVDTKRERNKGICDEKGQDQTRESINNGTEDEAADDDPRCNRAYRRARTTASAVLVLRQPYDRHQQKTAQDDRYEESDAAPPPKSLTPAASEFDVPGQEMSRGKHATRH